MIFVVLVFQIFHRQSYILNSQHGLLAKIAKHNPAERNRASKPPKVCRDFDVMPATTISVIGAIQVLLLPKDVTKGTSSEALVSLATLVGVTWICLVFCLVFLG